MKNLVSLIYVSSLRGFIDETDLVELLTTSRLANKTHNITGMLLYHDGNVMQVIEGDKTNIKQLFKNIKEDQRHHGIIKIVYEPISERAFSEWQMSYLNISTQNTEGFSAFLDKGTSELKNKKEITTAKRILINFRNQLRLR